MTPFSRCLLYSHHIYARSKIKSIQNLSQDYKVRGIFKVGRPGYIYINGKINDVQKSVKALKVLPSLLKRLMLETQLAIPYGEV